MVEPTEQRKREIDKMPSTWNDIDFSSFQPNEKLYWFHYRRIEPWLLKDTKEIKEKAESMFGLIALVCIGVEFLSKFRYGIDQSNIYFPRFLEEYLYPKFSYEIRNPYHPSHSIPPREKWFYSKTKLKYSEIFYFGMRNQLMHRFLLRHAVLIQPQNSFLEWERNKKRLLVDSRFLHVYFENGVRKYLAELWRSNPGTGLYNNFLNIFTENFERGY